LNLSAFKQERPIKFTEIPQREKREYQFMLRHDANDIQKREEKTSAKDSNLFNIAHQHDVSKPGVAGFHQPVEGSRQLRQQPSRASSTALMVRQS
jgi:hypothetical protein